ncbi:MAG: TonB-dependent receptor [Alphaproteobacteria bacterium]|nr:TonB-dependent receptor [Alphaproteobacteria bacterium]MBU1516799.1 TonB-dependent receptor [Alphaproteobacteria bacterium]MBU2092493.1 TonB-dependent receptor [Alphaproteobacteria bacterium]MBU2152376.1 TonB-dependent receptor [Alphaproteobacteria bacterium]MBU2305587.1 TonB-dependent receptor [Alphaproteobacteria bacterium]
MLRFNKRAVLFAAAAFGSLLASQACAQSADKDSASVAEVLVTAQKREQKLQDVPISMSVVSGQQMADFHAKDLKDLALAVPNLYVERLNAADVIYIRGFGSAPSNFAFDQSVSMYQDGIYAGRGKQFEAPFFDIERIEVLRGPQGALFGKNTPAGAISVVTAGPTPTFQGGVDANYNFNLNGAEVSGFISGPITDKLSARLAVKGLDLNGYVHNETTGKDDPRRKQGLARLTLRYEASPDLDLTAKFEHSDVHVLGANIVLASTTVPGLVTKNRFADGNPFGNAEAENIYSNGASLTGNYRIGEYTLTSVTGYSTYGANRSNSYSRDVPAIYVNRIIEHFKQFSQEVRLLSPADRRLEYIIGGYYDWSDYDLDYPKIYNLGGGVTAGSITSDFNQRAKTYSAFGQGTFHVTDELRAIGSLRYTRTEKSGRFATRLIRGAPLGRITTANGKIAEDTLDPSATLQYDVSPDIMVYATYARGSKSGGFVSNTVGTVDSTFIFRPEKSTNYEAGVKSSFFENRLVANVSIYHLGFSDLQTSVYDPTLNPPAFVTKNAAKARSKGVEAAVTWKPMQDLQVSWSGAYQKANYKDFPGANCLSRQPLSVCNPAAPASAPNSVANNNLAGAPLTFSSKWSGAAQVQHTAALGENLQLVTTGAVNYRSKYYNSDDQSPIYGTQQGYAKVDLRIQLSDTDERWKLALVGKNLTNKRTYSFAFNWPASLSNFPTAHKVLDETRTFALEGGLRF